MNRNVRQKKKLYPLPYHTYMSRSWQLIKRKSDLTVNTVLKHATSGDICRVFLLKMRLLINSQSTRTMTKVVCMFACMYTFI